MRFSVLLPTRNGGHQIGLTIKSVLDQGYHDMELVIVDNASTDSTATVVRSFGKDSRLRYVYQENFVTVTENWKRALDESTGDYFVMIGDDDCLLPNYFERIASLVHEHGYPDCVSYDGYLYLFPDTIQQVKESYFSDSHFNLFKAAAVHELSEAARLAIVRDVFRCRSEYLLSIQTNLIASHLAKRLAGGILQEPFPDFFAVNAVLLAARTFICVNEKLVVVGLSPKSFGHYYYAHRQAEGVKYLGSQSAFKELLPGDELLNGKYATLLKLQSAHAKRLGQTRPDRRAYVIRQVLAWYREYRRGFISVRLLLHRLAMLSASDWLGLALSLFDRTNWAFVQRRLTDRPARAGDEVDLQGVRLRRLANVRNILEFTKAVAASPERSAAAAVERAPQPK